MKHDVLHHASAGAVVYCNNNGVKFALACSLTPQGKLWTLPKGHIEEGERPIDAARREIGEEIAITCGLRFVAYLGIKKYEFRLANDPRLHVKKVYLFLLKSDMESKLSANQDQKIIDAGWFDAAGAKKLLKSDVMRGFLHHFEKAENIVRRTICQTEEDSSDE